MSSIDIITDEVLKQFGNRKTEGRIDFVFDLNNGNVYPVPKDLEHSEFIPTMLGYVPKTRRFVPSQIRLKDGKVKDIITGASSYEAKENVFHPLRDLFTAHKRMWEFILKSQIPIELERDEVLRNYAF